MALTKAQLAMAQLIMGIGARRGLSPDRQRELAAAAYAESGLNPNATNKSSGAAGLFQLLSSGYRNRAQQLGGLYNPRANTLAIINDYVNYWKQHPDALAGAAGRDVERSGMGADFYSKGLALLGGTAAGGGGDYSAVPTPQPAMGGNLAALVRQGILQSRRTGGDRDILSIIRNARQQAAVAQPTSAGPGEPMTTSDGQYVDPATGKIIGTPYSGTHTLGNWESDRAIDVAMPVGTPIRAPFGGLVGSQFGALGSGDPRFAGLRLHISNPEDEWYGAHLSRFAPGIKPGVRVRAGQIIGYSGSANGVAHLHEALRRGNVRALDR